MSSRSSTAADGSSEGHSDWERFEMVSKEEAEAAEEAEEWDVVEDSEFP